MKKNNVKLLLKKAAITAFAGVIAATTLTACGKKSEDDAALESGKVVIGITNNFTDVAFLNDDGELDGFEVELLKAIDEKLEDYEFEFQQSNFDNILISLDSAKVDLGTCMFEYSEERAEKYLYGNEGYRDYSVYLEAPKGSGYTTLESLAGKTIGDISATNNAALKIQQYNEENPDKAINLDYYGEGVSEDTVIKTLDEGRWEAIMRTKAEFEKHKKEYGDKYELGEIITESEAYFLFPKDGKHEQLRDAVDGAIKELKEEGIVDELSEKWFGTPAYIE